MHYLDRFVIVQSKMNQGDLRTPKYLGKAFVHISDLEGVQFIKEG